MSCLDELNKVREGEKIRALIRHCNPELNEDDRIVNLICESDGWHFLDLDMNRTHNELSWNWDIVDFRKINETKLLREAVEFIKRNDGRNHHPECRCVLCNALRRTDSSNAV